MSLVVASWRSFDLNCGLTSALISALSLMSLTEELRASFDSTQDIKDASNYEPLWGTSRPRSGSLAAIVHEEVQGNGLSKWSSYLITMNVIVGSGALGLPYAFRIGGLFMSLGLLLGSTILNTITMGCVLTCACFNIFCSGRRMFAGSC